MRITRLIAGVAVGGIVTFGAIGPASAANPILNIGNNGNGGQVDVLPVPSLPNIVKVTVTAPPDPIAKVKIGGTESTDSAGGLAALLADPLPLKVCILCHPAPLPT